MIMPQHVGMYRRSELIRLAGIPSDAVLRVAASRLRSAACDSDQHQQETDSESGNEVCGRCGVVIDDYADVAAARPERLCADHSGAAIGNPKSRCPMCLGTQQPRTTAT